MSFSIRSATSDDAAGLVRLIHALADYEKLADKCHAKEEALRKHLAPDALPKCEALVAVEDTDGKIVGMALYFYNYSTFLTKWGIFLEDLFVMPEARGQGVGFALLKNLAKIAIDKGCERLDWNVLDWNELAINFYNQLGAKPMSEWTTMRLEDEALVKVAQSAEAT